MNSDISVVLVRMPRSSKKSFTGPSTKIRLTPPKSSTRGLRSTGARSGTAARRLRHTAQFPLGCQQAAPAGRDQPGLQFVQKRHAPRPGSFARQRSAERISAITSLKTYAATFMAPNLSPLPRIVVLGGRPRHHGIVLAQTLEDDWRGIVPGSVLAGALLVQELKYGDLARWARLQILHRLPHHGQEGETLPPGAHSLRILQRFRRGVR